MRRQIGGLPRGDIQRRSFIRSAQRLNPFKRNRKKLVYDELRRKNPKFIEEFMKNNGLAAPRLKRNVKDWSLKKLKQMKGFGNNINRWAIDIITDQTGRTPEEAKELMNKWKAAGMNALEVVAMVIPHGKVALDGVRAGVEGIGAMAEMDPDSDLGAYALAAMGTGREILGKLPPGEMGNNLDKVLAELSGSPEERNKALMDMANKAAKMMPGKAESIATQGIRALESDTGSLAIGALNGDILKRQQLVDTMTEKALGRLPVNARKYARAGVSAGVSALKGETSEMVETILDVLPPQSKIKELLEAAKKNTEAKGGVLDENTVLEVSKGLLKEVVVNAINEQFGIVGTEYMKAITSAVDNMVTHQMGAVDNMVTHQMGAAAAGGSKRKRRRRRRN